MQYANNAATTLASNITNVATSLTVATGTGSLFPSLTGSQYFYCTLQGASGTPIEIVKVTAVSTDTFTIVRAQDGTTASAFSTGDRVELRLVRANLNTYPVISESNSFSAAQIGAVATLTDGATITPDFSTSNNFTVTLGGNRTLANPTNITAGQSGVIFVVQDATGSRTLSYGTYWKFPGGTAPTLTTTANAVDILAYVCKSSTLIDTVWIGNLS